MCQSFKRQCECGANASELFFNGNVLGISAVQEIYCPECASRLDDDVDRRDLVPDNGWVLRLDRDILEAMAPRMGFDADRVSAEQVFDGDFVTWVGFTPNDNVKRGLERDALAEQHADDKRAHFIALRDWAIEREGRLADEGWRKARRSRAN